MGAPRIGFEIDADIRRASLPPSGLYGDSTWFEAVRDRVLRRAWHWLDLPVGDANAVPVDLSGVPVLWVRSGDDERLLSNVCTHRGALVVDHPCRTRTLRCPYHGRRWSLEGEFLAAPGFEEALDFPRPEDRLAQLDLARFGSWRFGAADPASPFDGWMGPVRDRVPWFPWHGLERDPSADRDYVVEASWALYVDNYLEGFHVPYVHPSLAAVLDPRDYRNELLPSGTLQIGIATDPADAFAIPDGASDSGELVAGYYFWLFPTTMLNLYPWGVSVNVVEPLGPTRTRIRYRSWVADPSRRDRGAGGALDTVELEDQAIVGRAQAGVRSVIYPGGRYAPRHEVGLHHFHRLLAAALR